MFENFNHIIGLFSRHCMPKRMCFGKVVKALLSEKVITWPSDLSLVRLILMQQVLWVIYTIGKGTMIRALYYSFT